MFLFWQESTLWDHTMLDAGRAWEQVIASAVEQQADVDGKPPTEAHLRWLKLQRAVRESHEFSKAKPWHRSDSLAEVSSPWRGKNRGGSRNAPFTGAEDPPPHAAHCPCCHPFVPEKRAATPVPSDQRRAAILRRWHRPLLALRIKRLQPLHISTEHDLDLPLAQCPATSRGELPNGLSYFVRSCAKPAGRAVLRLVLRVGSLVEEEVRAHRRARAAVAAAAAVSRSQGSGVMPSAGDVAALLLLRPRRTSSASRTYWSTVPSSSCGKRRPPAAQRWPAGWPRRAARTAAMVATPLRT
jgi:hypothetical protein